MPDLWLPAGPDPLTTHRVESWRVDLLTADDATVGTLDGVTGLSLDHKAGATIHGGGTLSLSDVGQGVDWLSARVMPWFTVDGYGSWPLGVYLLASPRERHSDGPTSWRVELLDKLAVLDQDAVSQSYSLPAGTVVTDAVATVIAAAGETAVAITASTETLTSGMVWEAGTTRLRIANDLLASINYWSLRCDRYGRFTASPYVRPQDRVPVRAFTPGPDAIVTPDWSKDEDLIAVPNRVIVISDGTLDVTGLVGLAENTDASSRFSEPSRGRWITVVEDHDATSQTVADAIAARRLIELEAVSATYDIEHAMVPQDLHDVVTLTDGPASVQGWAVSLVPGEAGPLMLTTLRGVSS